MNLKRRDFCFCGTDISSRSGINERREMIMAAIDGCEAKYATPQIQERVCPKCGREVEVFIKRGRIVEDAVCECGYVFKAEEDQPLKVEHKEK